MKKSTIIKIVSGIFIGTITTAVFMKYFPRVKNKIEDFNSTSEENLNEEMETAEDFETIINSEDEPTID